MDQPFFDHWCNFLKTQKLYQIKGIQTRNYEVDGNWIDYWVAAAAAAAAPLLF